MRCLDTAALAQPLLLVQLTCMCFDKKERRLVTAGGDGSVIMWNFNNGSKLREYVHGEAKEEICTVRKRVLISEWIGTGDTCKASQS